MILLQKAVSQTIAVRIRRENYVKMWMRKWCLNYKGKEWKTKNWNTNKWITFM